MSEHDDLERRIRRAFEDVPVPPEVEEKAVESAVRGLRSRPRRRSRRRPRRRVVLLVALAILLLAAASAVAVHYLTRDEGRSAPASPRAEAALSESEVLGRAPWITQRGGSPLIGETTRLPALRFPAGTTYAQALDRLMRSVATDGTLPAGARLERRPLPAYTVWRRDRRAPALDLTAPWGFALPGGQIRPPSLRFPGLSIDEADRIVAALQGGRHVGSALATRARVDVPSLAPCQLLRPDRPAPLCALRDGRRSSGSS